MGTQTRRYVICYDICDAKRLQRIAKLLQSYGARVQKSVFECQLSNDRLERLRKKAEGVMDLQEDSLLIYHLPPSFTREGLGRGEGEGLELDLWVV